MATSSKRLVEAVSAHSFNKGRDKVALSPNNHQVIIYNTSSWQKEHVLKEHDQLVTGIHWGPITNRIVTCAQDRNAYVWTEVKGKWRPTLVLLRINRAATCVQWCANETKFAVGNGARCISVCYFEKENDWWVSKHIKKPIKSTITSVAWHPNNIVLAAGSTDFKCRLFSGFIKQIDSKDAASNPFGNSSSFGFGECLAEFEAHTKWGPGWVHGVAFSPDGFHMAFVGHDSTINFVGKGGKVQTVRLHHLPFTSVLFVTNNCCVAAGHDAAPYYFTNDGGNWSSGASMDKGADKNGLKIPKGDASATKLPTAHQNAITYISGNFAGASKEFSTSGVDGMLCTWRSPR